MGGYLIMWLLNRSLATPSPTSYRVGWTCNEQFVQTPQVGVHGGQLCCYISYCVTKRLASNPGRLKYEKTDLLFVCIWVSRQPTAKEAQYSINGHSCSEAKEILVQLIPLHSIPETSAIMTLYCVTVPSTNVRSYLKISVLYRIKASQCEDRNDRAIVNGPLSRHGLLLDVPPPSKRSRQDPATPIPPTNNFSSDSATFSDA